MSDLNIFDHLTTWHELFKAGPPIIVSGLTLYGCPISDVGIMITIIYTIFLTYVLIRDKIINYHPPKE